MLTWQVAIPLAVESRDADIDVAVNGITLAGSPLAISYRVQAFSRSWAEISPPQKVASVCSPLLTKLKRANRRLGKAKRQVKRSKRRAATTRPRKRTVTRLRRARHDLKVAERVRNEVSRLFSDAAGELANQSDKRLRRRRLHEVHRG